MRRLVVGLLRKLKKRLGDRRGVELIYEAILLIVVATVAGLFFALCYLGLIKNVFTICEEIINKTISNITREVTSQILRIVTS